MLILGNKKENEFSRRFGAIEAIHAEYDLHVRTHDVFGIPIDYQPPSRESVRKRVEDLLDDKSAELDLTTELERVSTLAGLDSVMTRSEGGYTEDGHWHPPQ